MNLTPLMNCVIRNQIPTESDLEFIKRKTKDAVNIADQRFYSGSTALMLAAAFNRVQFIPRLISEQTLQNDYGDTALIIAIQKGHIQIAKMLLCEKYQVDTLRRTPLMIAVMHSRNTLLPQLIELRGLRDAFGNTSLHYAVEMKNVELVKILCKFESRAVNNQGKTALIQAVYFNNPDVVDYLADYEARFQDYEGQSALMHAILDGRTEIAAKLVFHEAGLQDNHGNPALFYAIRCSNQLLIELLLPSEQQFRNFDGFTALMLAAKTNNISLVKQLIPQQIQVQNAYGQTALMIAASCGTLPRMKQLIQYESRMKDYRGQTALMYSVFQNDTESALLLLHESKIVDYQNRNALYYAIFLGVQELYKVLDLLEFDQLIRIFQRTSVTIQMFLARGNCIYFLKRYKVFRQQDNGGQTALIRAVQSESYDAVKYLAAYEHDICDHQGLSAIQHAVFVSDFRIFGVLFWFWAGKYVDLYRFALKSQAKEISDFLENECMYAIDRLKRGIYFVKSVNQLDTKVGHQADVFGFTDLQECQIPQYPWKILRYLSCFFLLLKLPYSCIRNKICQDLSTSDNDQLEHFEALCSKIPNSYHQARKPIRVNISRQRPYPRIGQAGPLCDQHQQELAEVPGNQGEHEGLLDHRLSDGRARGALRRRGGPGVLPRERSPVQGGLERSAHQVRTGADERREGAAGDERPRHQNYLELKIAARMKYYIIQIQQSTYWMSRQNQNITHKILLRHKLLALLSLRYLILWYTYAALLELTTSDIAMQLVPKIEIADSIN
ncbi:Serine/threonine-protein_kinase NEK [Hexamita inflata]|uniref:Serine/threonine-protein kinase NEK n=1 Tax=Hexamita inflata TaxID=28002 RepID=A0AA86QMJ5_9EUKA|nr:Serine/threonine-protein kinase NEK [Hexamita inflata]